MKDISNINPRTDKDKTNMHDLINKCGTSITTYVKHYKNLTPLNGKTPLSKRWNEKDIPIAILKKHQGNFGWVMGDHDLVVDVDPRNFRNGVDSFEALQKDLGITLRKTVKTPNGFHCYLKLPKGVNGAELTVGTHEYPGIDFRRLGHQCVIVGSRIEDKEYKWHEDNGGGTFEQPNAPQALITLLTSAKGKSAKGKSAKGKADRTVDDPFDGLLTNESGYWADEKVDALLKKLDPSMSHDQWVKVGMALHNYQPVEGLDLWEEWSKGGKNYDAGECAKRWSSFTQGDGITMGTIRAMAGEVNSAKNESELERFTGLIKSADKKELKLSVIPEIKESELDDIDRGQLAVGIQTRLKELTGVKPAKAAVMKLVSTPSYELESSEFEDWVYVLDHKKFTNVKGTRLYDRTGFNIEVKHLMPRRENGSRPAADKYLLDNDVIQNIDGIAYLPMYERGIHNILNKKVLNTYDHATVPVADDEYTSAGEDAIDTVDRHLRLICGTDERADILKMWLAHQVQNPGVLLRWAPLIQGFHGCGKGFLAELTKTLIGSVNVGAVDTDRLAGNFDSFKSGKCVNIIPEFVVEGKDRYAVTRKLRPMITDPDLQIELKGVDAHDVSNTTNYMLFTNDKNPIPLEKTDRRYWVVFSPFTDLKHFEADINEIGEHYFDRLYATLSHGGQLRKFFEDITITHEFRSMKRAPITDEKLKMFAMEESSIEGLEETLNMIEQGGRYYCEDVVCSADLFDDLKNRYRSINVHTTKRNKILTMLGYEQLGPIKINGSTRGVWSKSPLGNDEVREILAEQSKEYSDFESLTL